MFPPQQTWHMKKKPFGIKDIIGRLSTSDMLQRNRMGHKAIFSIDCYKLLLLVSRSVWTSFCIISIVMKDFAFRTRERYDLDKPGGVCTLKQYDDDGK